METINPTTPPAQPDAAHATPSKPPHIWDDEAGQFIDDVFYGTQAKVSTLERETSSLRAELAQTKEEVREFKGLLGALVRRIDSEEHDFMMTVYHFARSSVFVSEARTALAHKDGGKQK